MNDLETPGGTVRFRPIAPEDQELLYRIYASTREEELRQTDWSDEQKQEFLRAQFNAQHTWYQENYTEGAEFLVILRLGERASERSIEPAGRLYLARWAKEIRVVDIALLPEHRNGGVGGAILREILAEGDAAGRPVSIHVERFNPALRLYERLGFRPIEERGPYFLMERPVGAPAQVNTAS